MARIEKKASVDELQGEISSLKKQLGKKQDKKRFGISLKAIIPVVLLLIVIGYGVYVVAATGYKHIPIISSLVYSIPEPTRVISPVGSGTSMKQEIESAIASQVANGILANIGVTIRYDEDEVSGLLWQGIQREYELATRIDAAQVVILEDHLELYAEMGRDETPLYLIADIVPSVIDGELSLEVDSINIGAYTVPRFLGNRIVGGLIEKALDKVLYVTQSYAGIEAISLGDGYADLKLLFKKK